MSMASHETAISSGCPALVSASGDRVRTPAANCTLDQASHEVADINCVERAKVRMCAFPVLGIPGLAGKDPHIIDSAIINGDKQLVDAKVIGDKGGSVWIVEYYADWCPHCQAFAPKWQRLAVALREANSELRLVSVNCEVHRDLCMERKVQGYPTIEWFYNGHDHRVRSSLSTFYARMALEEAKSRHEVFEEYWHRMQHMPWTKQELEAALVAQGFLPPAKPAFLDSTGPISATMPHSKNEPELIEFIGGLPTSHSCPAEAVEEALLESDDGPALTCPPERTVTGDVFPNSGWPQDELQAPPSKRLADAGFMLGYTLRNWITPRPRRGKDLSAFDQDDLANMVLWLKGLSANFPVAQKEVKELLARAEAAKSSGKDLCVGDWLRSVADVEAVVGTSPPTGPGHCTTDTCRVWTLFHYMSLAEHQGFPGAASAQEAVSSITAFITNYFRCDHCRKHALEQLGAAAYGKEQLIQKGADGLPIYFWRFHNAVSVRIAAEGSCPGDRRWPPPDLCPTCWTKSDQEWDVLYEAKQIFSERRGGELNAGGALPDEGEVLKFLERTFSFPS